MWVLYKRGCKLRPVTALIADADKSILKSSRGQKSQGKLVCSCDLVVVLDLRSYTSDKHAPTNITIGLIIVDFKRYDILVQSGRELGARSGSEDDSIVGDSVVDGQHHGKSVDTQSKTPHIGSLKKSPTLSWIEYLKLDAAFVSTHARKGRKDIRLPVEPKVPESETLGNATPLPARPARMTPARPTWAAARPEARLEKGLQYPASNALVANPTSGSYLGEAPR